MFPEVKAAEHHAIATMTSCILLYHRTYSGPHAETFWQQTHNYTEIKKETCVQNKYRIVGVQLYFKSTSTQSDPVHINPSVFCNYYSLLGSQNIWASQKDRN